MNYGLEGVQCECSGDKEKMKKIELVVRCVKEEQVGETNEMDRK